MNWRTGNAGDSDMAVAVPNPGVHPAAWTTVSATSGTPLLYSKHLFRRGPPRHSASLRLRARVGARGQSRYGTGACDAERIRADELEEKVFAALLAVYSDASVLREAMAEETAGWQAEEQRRLDALAGIDAELRKAEAALERYMRAFEDGKLPPDLFGERVEQLARKAQQLRARRTELDVPVSFTAEALSDEVVRAIHADLSSTAHDAPEPVRKALAQAFVYELRVHDRRTVLPRFYVLPDVPTDPDPQGQP